MQPTVSIFVFNWNGVAYIKKCLDAVLSQTVKTNVILIDNASTDGSLNIAKKYPIKIIKNRKNYGIAYAQQQALNFCKTKWCAFCHVDCFPEKNWIKKMLKTAEKEGRIRGVKVGAIEPEVIHKGGVVLHGEVDFFFNQKRTRCKKYPNQISSCATLYRNTQLKLFDPSYFHYGEDVHASFALQRAGYTLVHEKSAKVNHIGSYSNIRGFSAFYLTIKNQLKNFIKFRLITR